MSLSRDNGAVGVTAGKPIQYNDIIVSVWEFPWRLDGRETVIMDISILVTEYIYIKSVTSPCQCVSEYVTTVLSPTIVHLYYSQLNWDLIIDAEVGL